MKKIIALASVILALSIGAFFYFNNNSHPAYGKYIADNLSNSYIVINKDKIFFNNVDFSSCEKISAGIMASEEKVKLEANNEKADYKELMKKYQNSLDYDSTFNGKEFSIDRYEKQDDGRKLLFVSDNKSGNEVYLEVMKKKLVCGQIEYSYKGK